MVKNRRALFDPYGTINVEKQHGEIDHDLNPI